MHIAEGEAQLIFVLDTSSLIHLQKDDVFRSVFTDLLLNERTSLLDDQDLTTSVTFLIPLRVIFELDSMKKDVARGKICPIWSNPPAINYGKKLYFKHFLNNSAHADYFAYAK